MRSRHFIRSVPFLLSFGLGSLACAWVPFLLDPGESDPPGPSLSAESGALQGFTYRFDGTMEENIVNADGGTSPITTTLQLDVSGSSGSMTGSLKGVGLYEQAFVCRNTENRADIWDTATISFTMGYTADVNTSINLDTGEFSAPFAPQGSLSFFELVKPFTDSRCTNLNSDPPRRVELNGTGRIYGVINSEAGAVVNTEWTAGEGADVNGTWTGQGIILE